MMDVDPVTLAVVRGALEQIADEMDLHLIRAALSPIISETNDCAHGLYDPASGETIAQGSYGLPQFLANMQWTVQRVIAEAAAEGGFADGDLWIVNDPYLSGTHLNDVVLVSPVFVDGALFTLFANTGHWMDMGGSAPGGWVPSATEIHQEGIIIPPLKLFERGRYNEAVVRLITANVEADLHDLVESGIAANESTRFASALDADDYGASQSLGRRLRAADSWGIRYPSVRHAGGECVGILRPRALRHAKAAAHLALHWDGARITHWYEKRQPHAFDD